MTQLINLFSSIILCITIDAENHLPTHINSVIDNDIAPRLLLSNEISSDWVISRATLPQPDVGMAAAHFNNKIYLFGGIYDACQRVDYDIALDKTVNQGFDALSEDVQGFSNQFYTQIEHTLYFIDAGWGQVIMYVLATDNDFLDTLTNVPQNA
eukprot:807073_1